MKKVIINSKICRWDEYVPICLKSVINQTYDNWIYYILVSEDSESYIKDFLIKELGEEVFTNKIILCYFEDLKDPTERYLMFTENGDYIFNIDGDDYLELDCVEKLVEALEETDSDIACCGVAMHDVKSGSVGTVRTVEKTMEFKRSEYCNNFPFYFQFYRTMWGKLYKSSLFTDDTFKDIPIGEERGGYAGDTMCALAILSQTKKFVILEDVGYHYMIWEGNVSKKFLPNREKADPLLYPHLEKFLLSCDKNISPRNKDFLAVIHNNGIGDVLKVLATSDLAIDDKLDKLHYIITNEVSVKTIPHAHPQALDVFRHTYAQFSSYYQGKKSKGLEVAQDIFDKLKDVEDVLSLKVESEIVSKVNNETTDNSLPAMNMVRAGGGLANQIYQYIFLRYLEIQTKKPYIMDNLELLSSENPSHNGFEIDKVFPNLKLKCVTDYLKQTEIDNIITTKRKLGDKENTPNLLKKHGFNIDTIVWEQVSIKRETNPQYDNFDGTHVNCCEKDGSNYRIPTELNGAYYIGVFPGQFYFDTVKEKVLQELQFPPITNQKNSDYYNHIKSSLSVGIHVRRGDFVKLGWDLPASKYAPAVIQVKQQSKKNSTKPTFFIISDDMNWCKENIKDFGLKSNDDVVFVEGNFGNGMNYIDLQFLATCKIVISNHNSSFSRVALWLNQDLIGQIRV